MMVNHAKSYRTACFALLLVVGVNCAVISDVKADWSVEPDTLPFDNSTYQLYHNNSGTFVEYTTANGASTVAGTGYGGIDYSTGVFTAGDDKAVPYNAWFKVDNGGSPVYVRMAFDRSTGGTPGSIDSGDIPVVFEDTSRNTAVDASYNLQYKYNSASPQDASGSNLTTIESDQEAHWGFTSKWVSWGDGGGTSENTYVITDAVESGYEDQAGEFWVRSAKGTATTEFPNADIDSGVSGNDTYFDDGYSRTSAQNDDWDSFIIEYAGADVTAATGEIWDIDTGGTNEVFTVKAYNGASELGTSVSDTAGTYNSNPADSLAESNANSFDALPWAWAFSGLSSPITKIVFTRTGHASQYPLAFNNFNPVSSVSILTPEPSSILAFFGLFGVAGLRRRKRSV